MAVYHGLNHQYASLENLMRAKFLRGFPDKDTTAFEFWFISDRGRADGSGRAYRYTFDERRWMSEKLTWKRFWPEEEFPATKPPSSAEMAELNMAQAYQHLGFNPNRGHRGGYRGGRGGGRAGYRGYQQYRSRGIMMSPSRGRGYFRGGGGSNPREAYYARGQAIQQCHASFGSFVRGEQLSSFDSDSELISLHNDTTSSNQDRSSLITADTADTQLSDNAQVFNAHTIVCRRCGVVGHPEMQCRYQIVIKQGLDRERHLVCGIVGHKAFRFNSYHGCLECNQERVEGTRQKIANGEGVEEEKYTREEAASEAELEVAVINMELNVTGATGVKSIACGWEETEYNDAIEAVRMATLGSFDEPAKPIITGFTAHKLKDHAKLWEIEEVEEVARDDGGEVEGKDGQCLIQF